MESFRNKHFSNLKSIIYSSIASKSIKVFVFNFSGLETLGVYVFDKNPPGADVDKISSEVFLKEA